MVFSETGPKWTIITEDNERLAAFLRGARERAGCSRRDLAATGKIVATAVEYAELGRRSPTVATLARYAAALGHSLAIGFLDSVPTVERPPLESRSPLPPMETPSVQACVAELKRAVAAEIRAILHQRELTAREASRLTGITRAQFTRVLRGNLKPLPLESLLAMRLRLQPAYRMRLVFYPQWHVTT